ncbi:MAG: pyrimidine 5'-nucleotidase [Chloroflexota bacterium]
MDKRSYKYILFDLDETLYPREAGLMDALSRRMHSYMVQKLGIPADDVPTKRRAYYQQYGTTLRGLIEEYHIDPAEFLTFVHDVDPGEFFGASPPLADMLNEIPLLKVIFTNANYAHSERVLNTLRVRLHFGQIIDIQALGYKNKPDPLAYYRALALLQTSGESCIIVDDTARNLIPAKDVGMTTILVDSKFSTPSIAIDYVVPTVFHVGQVVRNLLPQEGLF